jgi:hypothetical protein
VLDVSMVLPLVGAFVHPNKKIPCGIEVNV